MDFYGWVESAEFGDVGGEAGGGVVAEVDGAGGVVGELVGRGAADAEGGGGAGYDYYFVFYASVGRSVLVRSMEGGIGEGAYGPAESGAMRRILGRSSIVLGSAGLMVSCSLRECRRCLGKELMAGRK